MAMHLMEKPLNPDSPLSWFTYERRNWIAIAGLCVMAGYWTGNGHTTQEAIAPVAQQLNQKSAQLHKLETNDVPKLKSALGCEHKAKEVALNAVSGDPSAIQALPDCPPISTVAKLGHPSSATK